MADPHLIWKEQMKQIKWIFIHQFIKVALLLLIGKGLANAAKQAN